MTSTSPSATLAIIKTCSIDKEKNKSNYSIDSARDHWTNQNELILLIKVLFFPQSEVKRQSSDVDESSDCRQARELSSDENKSMWNSFHAWQQRLVPSTRKSIARERDETQNKVIDVLWDFYDTFSSSLVKLTSLSSCYARNFLMKQVLSHTNLFWHKLSDVNRCAFDYVWQTAIKVYKRYRRINICRWAPWVRCETLLLDDAITRKDPTNSRRCQHETAP